MICKSVEVKRLWIINMYSMYVKEEKEKLVKRLN